MERARTNDRVVGLLIAAALIFAPAVAAAEQITVDFAGWVHTVSGSAVGGPVGVGDPVTGRVVYERSGGVDLLPSDPGIGRYAESHILSFDLTAGAYSATADQLGALGYVKVERRDDIGLDGVLFRTGVSGASVNGVAPYAMQFALREHSPPLLPDIDLPSADDLRLLAPMLPAEAFNFVVFGGPGTDRFDWTVTSYVVTPEPGAGALVAAGLLALARGARRRRRRG